MQWLLAVRETVVIKPSTLNIVAQGLPSSLPIAFLIMLKVRFSTVASDNNCDVFVHVRLYFVVLCLLHLVVDLYVPFLLIIDNYYY